MKTVWMGETQTAPLGIIWAAVSENGLAAVGFEMSQAEFTHYLERRGFQPVIYDPERAGTALQQVKDYLEGRRTAFDIPIDWEDLRPFQQEVLRLTAAIPFGQVTTYAEIARKIGKPRAARAVGRAEATNPMPLVIPCHRVLGSDGKLHGYGGPGGTRLKAWLLNLEQS